MEENYSKRELDDHFKDLKELLGDIKSQVVKTNGRVTKLENWRSFLVGAWIVAYMAVIPLLVYLYANQMNYIKTIISQNTEAIEQINHTLLSL